MLYIYPYNVHSHTILGSKLLDFYKINCVSTVTIQWFDLCLPHQLCTILVSHVRYREIFLQWPFRVTAYKLSCPDIVFRDILKLYSYTLKEKLHQKRNILWKINEVRCPGLRKEIITKITKHHYYSEYYRLLHLKIFVHYCSYLICKNFQMNSTDLTWKAYTLKIYNFTQIFLHQQLFFKGCTWDMVPSSLLWKQQYK